MAYAAQFTIGGPTWQHELGDGRATQYQKRVQSLGLRHGEYDALYHNAAGQDQRESLGRPNDAEQR